MTALGFNNRNRRNTGWQINIGSKEEEQVYALFAAYRVDLPPSFSITECRKTCDLCKKYSLG